MSLWSLCKCSWGRWLMKIILPNHIKRLIFLVSLFCIKVDDDELRSDITTLKALNEELKLADIGYESLIIPSRRFNYVFDDFDVLALKDTTAENIVRRMPDWLHYSSHAKTIRDVRLLLRFHLKLITKRHSST